MNSTHTDSQLLRHCIALHSRSHDPHRQVGVVITDRDGNIISEGVNAPPERLGLSKADSHVLIGRDPDWKYFMLEHAERNAIHSSLARNVSLQGATMYASLYPCADCARAIVASGIMRLVVLREESENNRDARWRLHRHYADKAFGLGQVEVVFVELPAQEVDVGTEE